MKILNLASGTIIELTEVRLLGVKTNRVIITAFRVIGGSQETNFRVNIQ